MALTLEAFRDRFPEFGAAPDSLVNACLAEAELFVSAKTWHSTQRNQGVAYWAAHLIASNPSGEFTKIDEETGDTHYSRQYARLARIQSAGFRLI